MIGSICYVIIVLMHIFIVKVKKLLHCPLLEDWWLKVICITFFFLTNQQ